MAKPFTQFEILVHGATNNRSRVLNWAGPGASPAAGALAYPRGFPVGAHATDPTQCAPASSQSFLGHLTRDVRVGGPVLTDLIFGPTNATPTGVTLPWVLGQVVSLESAQEIEAEGVQYILTSGVQAVTASTPVGTPLTFINGQLAIFPSGTNDPANVAFYSLSANNLPASDGTSLRIRAERI